MESRLTTPRGNMSGGITPRGSTLRRDNSTMSTPRRHDSRRIPPNREESFRSLNGTLNRSNISNKSATTLGRTDDFSYSTLRERALARRVLFEDPHFPALDSSVKINYHNLIDDIEWKRPHEISKRPRFVSKNPGKFEVVPGPLGSTWLYPAFSSLSLAPTLIQRCIPDEQAFDENYAGIFRFRFWRFGKWIEINIDDRLPSHNGKLLFTRNSDQDEFWAALFEKAYAKNTYQKVEILTNNSVRDAAVGQDLHYLKSAEGPFSHDVGQMSCIMPKLYGSYAAVIGTRIHWALQDLTGGVTDSFIFNDNRALLQKMLDTTMERCTLINATIKLQGPEVRQISNGLVTGRAYNITGYAEYSDGGKNSALVRVRNPWIKPEWIGKWSDRSPLWNTVGEEMKEKLNYGQLKPGEFWMSFEEFSTLFTHIELCHLPPEAWQFDEKLRQRRAWKSVAANRQWMRGFNAGGSGGQTVSYNSQFYIELPKQCNIVLSLMQRYKLLGEDREFVPCACLIFKAPKDRKTRMQSNHFTLSSHVASSGVHAERDIVRFFTLPAGSYVILPVTEAVGIEGKFFLRIFADDKEIVVRELDDPDTATNVQIANHLDDEERVSLRRRFLLFCNRYEEIDGYGLREILSFKPKTSTADMVCCMSEPVKEDSNIQRVFLSPETCKAAITIVDKDMSGRLNYDEFISLVQRLSLWQNIFRKFAVTNGSVMDSFSLRNAFRMAGFSVSNKILEALVLRFAAKDFINLEGFINSVVKLHVSHQIQGKRLSEKGPILDDKTNKNYLQDLLRTAIYS